MTDDLPDLDRLQKPKWTDGPPRAIPGLEPVKPYDPDAIKWSPSAIGTFNKCPRRLALQRWCGIPRTEPPYNDPRSFGTRGHRHAQRWLDDGLAPDDESKEAQLFVYGTPFLPRPGPGTCTTEFWIEFKIGRHTVYGKPDAADVADDFGPRLTVYDHKFSADPATWGLTEETLPLDVAFQIYAEGTARIYDELGGVVPSPIDCATFPDEIQSASGRWIYYNKRSPTSTGPVDVVVSREANRVHLRALEPTLDRMRDVAYLLQDAVDPIATANALIPHDPNACDGYGKRCDQFEFCHLHNGVTIDMSTTTMDKLKALQAAAAAKRALANPVESAAALKATEAEVTGIAEQAPAAVTPPSEPVATPAAVTPAATPPKAAGRPKGSTNAPKAGDTSVVVEGLAALSSSAIGQKILAGESVTLTITIAFS